MSSDVPDVDPNDVRAAQVTNARIEDEMEQSYIDYAMSVIAGRALPDVRDGLKPVHRRILYAMHEAGVTSNSSHRKSSSIVGETMGDYHPHGDSAIYDTLARMAQDFSMRYPLVDGQGNFGSVDGDPPAAMRYTEARMAPIAEELLADIERDTVDFQANYDDRLEEPAVLPSAFPNLLVNGSSGIAVGMSTNIPPHNLGEVIDATVELIENPDATVEDLMEHVKGPDFPTGANIVGRSAVHKAYKTGRGRVRVRAEFEVDEEEGRIVISELPFQQNKSRLVERIAEDVNEGSIEGIRDLRDESDRDGIRVVVELKRDAMAEVVKNQLLESHLERTFGVINLALVDGAPQVLDLKETLEHYVEHRRDVVRRRSEHELGEREDRAHILEGRLKALENVDSVVETIQDSDDRDAAKAALATEYDFTEPQAEHIVRMQLGSLTSMETQEIESEYADVTDRIERLETILGDPDELDAVIVEELQAIRDEYADERRTSFIEDVGDVTHEDLIPEEECVVVMSEDDYIKRMSLDTFRAQNRGGKGIIGTGLKEGDRVSSVFAAAYDPREQNEFPEVGHVIANAIGRSIIRTRLTDSVDAIPADALAFLGAIPEYVDEFHVAYEESYTYGWGIGHPEHSVSDQLRKLAETEPKWGNIVLTTAFYADQQTAIDVFEEIVTDDSLSGTIQRMTYDVDLTRYYFGAVADLERDFLSPHAPIYWEWEDEIDYSFDLDPDVEQQIRQLARETGVVEDLPADWTLPDLDPSPLSGFEEELF